MPSGDISEASEEVSRRMVVPALRLNGLDDHGSDRPVVALLPVDNQVLHRLQTPCLLRSVGFHVLFQWVFESREVSNGPREGGDVQFVGVFCVRCRQAAKRAAMEPSFEGEDAQLRGAGRLADQCGFFVLIRVFPFAAALSLAPPALVDEARCFVCILIGAAAARHRAHIGHARRRNTHQNVLHFGSKVLRRHEAQRSPVDEQRLHVRQLRQRRQTGMVVTQGYGCDVAVHVEHPVPIGVYQVVALTRLEVNKELHRTSASSDLVILGLEPL
mmetsp:Transcript_25803/g.64050  ORF Transcript_25803/g.64050 Transcript_25803/m.64050 type:complete len:272 (-) Transcript_25803:260-1075(-)